MPPPPGVSFSFTPFPSSSRSLGHYAAIPHLTSPHTTSPLTSLSLIISSERNLPKSLMRGRKKEREKEREKERKRERSGRRNAEGGWGWQDRRNRGDEGKGKGGGGDDKSAEAGFRGLEKMGGGVGTWLRTETRRERAEVGGAEEVGELEEVEEVEGGR